MWVDGDYPLVSEIVDGEAPISRESAFNQISQERKVFIHKLLTLNQPVHRWVQRATWVQ